VFEVNFGNEIFYVSPENILWIKPNEKLQISYLVFKESFLQRLLKKRMCLKVFITETLPESSQISVLECNKVMRDGFVEKYEGAYLYHSAYTSNKSAGCPIVNENYHVIGIHKGATSKYHVGVKMNDVVEDIKKDSGELVELLSNLFKSDNLFQNALTYF
jgi:hypothetical protein